MCGVATTALGGSVALLPRGVVALVHSARNNGGSNVGHSVGGEWHLNRHLQFEASSSFFVENFVLVDFIFVQVRVKRSAKGTQRVKKNSARLVLAS